MTFINLILIEKESLNIQFLCTANIVEKKNIQHIIILLLIYTHFPCSLFMLNKTPLIVMYILQLPYSRYTVFSQLKTPGIYLFETLWT